MNRKSFLFAICIISGIINYSTGQTVLNYQYNLTNGSKVVTEKGWNRVYVKQVFINIDSAKPEVTVLTAIISIGKLISKSDIMLLKDEKKVDALTAKEGSYSMKIKCSLQENAGFISFDVDGIEIKTGMQTHVTISVHDALIRIAEKNEKSKGLSYYEYKLINYSGNQGIRSEVKFFSPGTTTPRITPAEPMGDYYGLIKSGTYDLNLLNDINMAGFGYVVWLKNMSLKPDCKYYITIDLNAAEVRCAVPDNKIMAVYFYPVGTADTQNGTAKPDKKKQVYGFERPARFTLSPPGTYDILIDYNWGEKYEWRKGIVCKAGEKTEIK